MGMRWDKKLQRYVDDKEATITSSGRGGKTASSRTNVGRTGQKGNNSRTSKTAGQSKQNDFFKIFTNALFNPYGAAIEAIGTYNNTAKDKSTSENALYDPTEFAAEKEHKSALLKPYDEAIAGAEKQLENSERSLKSAYIQKTGIDFSKPVSAAAVIEKSAKDASKQFAPNTPEKVMQDLPVQEISQVQNVNSYIDGKNAEKKLAGQAIDRRAYEAHAKSDPDFNEAAKQGSEYKSKLADYFKGSDFERWNAGYLDDNTAAYNMLTPDEIKTYTYYLTKNDGDETVANKYLESIMPDLQERTASMLDEKIESIDNEAAKKIARGATTVAGASKNTQRAFMNMPAAFTGSDEVILPGVVQQTQQKMRSRLEGPEAFVNDAIYSGVQMGPTFAANMIPGVGQAAGTAMVMATSYSDAYSSAIAQGYDPSEAAAYAIPSAVAEGLTQYALNGVKAFGASSELGKTVERAAKNVSKNPAVQKVMASLGNMGGEALEEYLQANIDPVLRNLALGEDNEINPFSQDKLEAALMGAVLSGAMNAPAEIEAGIANAKQRTASVGAQYTSDIQSLIDSSKQSAPDTRAFKLGNKLQQKMETGQAPSDYEIGRLVHENDLAIAAEQKTKARQKAEEIQNKLGIQRAYNRNDIVELADGSEAAIVERDGNAYTVTQAGKPGYSTIDVSDISRKIEGAKLYDKFYAPEKKVQQYYENEHKHLERVATQKFVEDFGQAMGVNVDVRDFTAEGKTTVKGMYDGKTDTIFFDKNATRGQVLYGVIAHELTHAAESSPYYNKYFDYVIDRLTKGDPSKVEKAIDFVRNGYKGIDPNMTRESALQEIVASYTESLYTSQEDIDALVKGQPNIAVRMYNAIRTAMDKLAAYFKGDKTKLQEINQYQELIRAREMFEKALKDRNQQTEAAQAYALNPNFEAELDNWDGVSNNIFDVGTPSSPLLEFGIQNNRIVWYGEKIAKILKDHPEMTLDIIKQTPQVLEDPVMILKSNQVSPKNKGKASRLVLFGEVYDTEGAPVLAALEIRPRLKGGDILDLNIVKSAYGKSNDLKGFIEKSDALYLDPNKNRTNTWLRAVGLQLPAVADSTYGSIGRITFEGKNVKIEGIPFKEWASGKMQIKKNHPTAESAETSPITSETISGTGSVDTIIKPIDEDVNPKYSIGQDLSGIENIEKEAMQHISDADAPAAEYTNQNTFILEPEAELEKAIMAHDAEKLEYARKTAKENIVINPRKEKVTLRQSISDFIDGVQRKFIDSGHEVTKLGERPEYYLNSARDALQSADYNVGYARGKETHQTDIFGRGNRGKSLAAIYEKINAAGEHKVSNFSEYMYHLHNTDRMGLVARAQKNIAKLNSRIAELLGDPDIASEYRGLQEAAISTAEISDGLKEVLRLENDIANLKLVNNKPIFGNEITAEQSKQIASGLLKKNKEFAAWEAEIRQYVKNNMELRIEAGLTSREFADILNELYPHYVPVFREGAQESRYPSDRDVIISATVKRAVGGDGPIGNLENSLAQQTRSIFTQGRKNLAVDAVMDSLLKRGDVQELVTDMRYRTAAETDGGIETGTDKIIFYRDGARIELSVDPKLAEAFRAFNGYQEGKAGTVLRNINNTYKKLITQWNPTFIVRNFFKDFQDALIYSKYGIKTFTQSYGKALSHIKSNNAWWQLYQSSGGFASSIFENMADADIVKRTGKRSKFGRLVDGISQANMVVEQAPRFAEFIATLESYGMNPQTVTPDVLSEALYNANDITCNFGRSGTWGKMINKYAVSFFNPSIQGFDKLLRAFRAGDAKTAVKQMVSFAAKSAILGASVSILDELLCSLVGDDDDREEYKRMSDYTKNAYYMIPLGNGQFFKIPKGRITSITGNLMQGIVRDIISGDQDENKTDWSAYGESVINNVAPTNPLENFVGSSAIRVLGNNKRWTGQEIENAEDQKKPVAERYDEKTSGAGKFLSQTLGLSNIGISPKKADAMIDETTGVLGDFLLPLTSSQAAQSPLTMGFVTDSNISNKRSGQIYDLKQKLTEQSYMEGTSKVPSVTDLALDFIADSQKAVWDNKDRIREINEQDVNGTEIINLLLGKSPRQKEVSAINRENAEINERILQKFDAFTQSLQQYYNVDEEADEEIQKAQAEEAYLKAYREVMGADDAIKVLSDSKIKAYEKASEKGIGAQTYMDYVISTVHAEKDADRASALLGMELSDDELLGLYTAAIEKDTTKEKNTMEFAVKNGLTPKQFLVKKYGDELSAQSAVSGQSAADEGAAKTVIADAQGYDIPNYKGETLEKIASIGVSVQDYAYVDERLAAHDDKVGYIRSLGFDEKQTRGLVESLVMGKAARSKMTVAADMGIDKDVYTDVYIVGYTSQGSKAERNEQIRAYVDSLPGLSQEQKDALYEWNKVSKGSTASTGGSSPRRSSGGSRSSGSKGSTVSSLPEISADAWAKASAALKRSKAPKAQSIQWLSDIFREADVRREAMQQQLDDIDRNPIFNAKMKAAMKAEVRRRYQEG